MFIDGRVEEAKPLLDPDIDRLEPADQFWGDRHGRLTDPFGHGWNIAQHLRDVSPEEVAEAAAKAFGGA